MDAVNQIGRILKVKGNSFGFAGTKDRRAVTVQRMSLYRIRHEVLDFLNGQIPAFKMGDYKYSKYPIQLGDHGGNQFKITIKNAIATREQNCSLERRVHLTEQAVDLAVTEISKHGFINYYGLQRFGTHIVGTHELGMLLLKEDYEGAVDGLLHVDQDFMKQVVSGTIQETPMNRDDINRVRAIVHFKTNKDADAALKIMPKRFSSEMHVIEHLQKHPRDFAGAILRITRGMRNLYLHAYQSYVWNHVASHRWVKYGSQVITGDLVLTTTEDTAGDDLDEASHFQRARALSEEEVKSGKYSIFDVVLPGPGFDVSYPQNDIGQFYVDFMKQAENGGLNPHSMRRPIKDFNVSGNYRHLLGRFKGEPKWEVRTYVDDNEQMVPTDLDLIMIRKEEEKSRKKQDQEDATSTSTPAPTGTVRRRESESKEVGGESEQPNSKRPKLAGEVVYDRTSESADPREPGQGSGPQVQEQNNPQRPSPPHITASPADIAGASTTTATTTATSPELTEPIRQPTVPNGSTGFATNQTDVSKSAAAEGPEELTVARFGQGSIQSFQQRDLSNHSEDEIKIAVVLEFGLSTSAYATVILRELMAEVEPEQPDSPL